ncbi:hypothetical protein D3C71_1442960 [compost metagenome]
MLRLDRRGKGAGSGQADDDGVAVSADQLAQLWGDGVFARLGYQLALGIQTQLHALAGQLVQQADDISAH